MLNEHKEGWKTSTENYTNKEISVIWVMREFTISAHCLANKCAPAAICFLLLYQIFCLVLSLEKLLCRQQLCIPCLPSLYSLSLSLY